MIVTMPDDSDVFHDLMDRVGMVHAEGTDAVGYIIGIDPMVDTPAEVQNIDIECHGLDSDTGGISGYRLDADGDRVGPLEVFHGVDHIIIY